MHFLVIYITAIDTNILINVIYRSSLAWLPPPPPPLRLSLMNMWRLRLSRMYTRRFQPSLTFTLSLSSPLKLLVSSTGPRDPRPPPSQLPWLPPSSSQPQCSSLCPSSSLPSLPQFREFRPPGPEAATTIWVREFLAGRSSNLDH